jgi:hypothetical protein
MTGTMLPRSTTQALKGQPASLGLVTGVSRGNNGNIWISDIDNDRVIEVGKTGELISGFMGSFLSEPNDVYLNSSNSVSNTTVIAGNTSANIIAPSINVVHSIYNTKENALYIICDHDIENIYSINALLNLENIYLKIGSYRIYFNDADIELLGVDKKNLILWSNSSSITPVPAAEETSIYSMVQLTTDVVSNLNQFTFNSHVLKISPKGADATLLNYLINQKAPSIIVSSPLANQLISTNNVVAKFLTYNFDIGTAHGEPAIKVILDGGTPQIIYSNSISFEGLSNGIHYVYAELLKADGTPYLNYEASVESTFIVENSNYSLPYAFFNSPCSNQIFSSSPVEIEFTVSNFAIVPSGQHVKYVVDDASPVDYYSSNPIVLNGLDAGQHSISIYIVDQNGKSISQYPYANATVKFIVGLNSNAITKLFVNPNAIYNFTQDASCPITRINVDVAPLSLQNIYAPIDVQFLDSTSNEPSVLIAKLRSPSWTYYLAGEESEKEITERIQLNGLLSSNASAANVNAIVLNSNLAAISTSNLVYATGFLDGHSIVEIDMKGKLVFSNNDAKIGATKTLAKDILGSCQKLGDNEVLIGDAYGQQALIAMANTISRESIVQWSYDSDRYVSDCHIIPQDDIVLEISDMGVSDNNLFIRTGQSVIWENNSSSNISIYSGTTNYNLFYQNPNLALYGDKFRSVSLAPGEKYSVKFNSPDKINWFAYPTIITGRITVTEQRLSDRDQYLILENDMLETPFSSRVIRDSYGNIIWTFGNNYLVKPRDARPLLDNKILIST